MSGVVLHGVLAEAPARGDPALTPAGSLFAALGRLDPDAPAEALRRAAVTHFRLLERLCAEVPVIPARFPQVFESAAAAQHAVATEQARWRTLLAWLGDDAEFAVTLRKGPDSHAASSAGQAQDRPGDAAGASYLRARAVAARRRATRANSDDAAHTLADVLARSYRAATVAPSRDVRRDRVVMVLAPRSARALVAQSVARWATRFDRLAPGLSGPMPVFTFLPEQAEADVARSP
ncbi:MAG: GvpL/GvpF family gas vesicle protein [Pseudomonadota bacterium]